MNEEEAQRLVRQNQLLRMKEERLEIQEEEINRTSAITFTLAVLSLVISTAALVIGYLK